MNLFKAQTLVQTLFPVPVEVEVVSIEPYETQFLERIPKTWHNKRKESFIAGRKAAALALKRLGWGDIWLEKGNFGEPMWPKGAVGSITHSKTYALAAVAKANAPYRAIGVDLEVKNRCHKGLWPFIFTDSEQQFLREQTEPELWATRFFCAKEAFYKAQYPLTELRLHFKDATVENLEKGSLRVVLNKVVEALPRALQGKYVELLGHTFVGFGVE